MRSDQESSAISCREFLACLCDFLTGELSVTLEPLATNHLYVCPHCALVVRSAKETLRLHFEAALDASDDSVYSVT